MLEICIIFLLAFGLALPLGLYMTKVFLYKKHFPDHIFNPIERLIYRLIGVDADKLMTWKQYTFSFLVSNLMLGIVAFLILKYQHILPLNPDGIGPLSWDLALHTAISFLTNTNQQHYSGQAQLTYLSQGTLIVTLQFITPAMGLAVCVAIIKAMTGGVNNDSAKEGEERLLGNFYVDTIKGTLRVLIPLACIFALALSWQGVPSTFSASQTIQTIDSQSELTHQTIPVGPVAAMVAIKQLGTNGGGWYAPNSSNPLENPTPVSNAIETIALVLVPMAIVFMAGGLMRRKSFSVMTFVVMSIISVSFITLTVYSELQPNAAFQGLSQSGPNMEGKEVRLGVGPSALWATFTTQTSNGSVNAMHDSFNPLGGLITRSGMLISAIWGGIGGGFVTFMVYVWLAVFLSGLMIGRTPEIFGRKIETKEITMLSSLILLPALTILSFTAITLTFPSLTGNSNPGFHGISQVFYEYTSAFANNGSGFEGLSDDTIWWNISCSIVLLLGRYLPLIIPLMIAGSLAKKRVSPSNAGSLRLESPTFAATLIAVILIINVLSFLPAAVIGPIGEALELTTSVVGN
ncbi:potassium-transporting ATPase subunit KdpA [Vibrio metschnikovii]|uniref:potassium-transporting ATPase subunit KdpA n=1 Tax=Vibrio metschnikovii TaxID=28172 RepID=UPI001C2F8E98|nr:potassium-transporting ATPase subunit KdpA [Vibrio metschnikovii]